MLKPRYSLSAVASIETSNLYSDVLDLVKEVSEVVTYKQRGKGAALLLDDAMKVVTIGVWDDAGKADSNSLVKQIANLEGKVAIITGIKSWLVIILKTMRIHDWPVSSNYDPILIGTTNSASMFVLKNAMNNIRQY